MSLELSEQSQGSQTFVHPRDIRKGKTDAGGWHRRRRLRRRGTDFTTPKNICDAAEKAIEEGFTKYTPASGTNELKQAVSEKFRKFNGLTYKPSQIVISNGGKHALTNIFTVLVNPGDEVIIPAPYWLSYPEMVKLAGGVPVFVYGAKDNGFKPTAQQIEAAR
jgi:aspartate aminotransferase